MTGQSTGTGTKPKGNKTPSTVGVAAIGAIGAVLVAAISNSEKLAPLLPWGHAQPAATPAAVPAASPTPVKTEPAPVVRVATKTVGTGKVEVSKNKAGDDKKASDKAVEDQAAEQTAAAKAAGDKAEADRIAIEKASAAEKAAAEKAAAEKAEADRIAREKAAATRPMLVLREIAQIHNGFLHDNWTFEISVNNRPLPDVTAHQYVTSEKIIKVGASEAIVWAPQPLVDDGPYFILMTAQQIGGSLRARGAGIASTEPNKTTHVHLKTAHAMTGGEFDFAFVVQR